MENDYILLVNELRKKTIQRKIECILWPLIKIPQFGWPLEYTSSKLQGQCYQLKWQSLKRKFTALTLTAKPDVPKHLKYDIPIETIAVGILCTFQKYFTYT